MALYDYRIALGSNVALGSLSNIESILAPYADGRILAPAVQPVNPFPVRTVLMNGRTRGDGRIDLVWSWNVMPILAFKYIQDTFFSSGTVVSAAVTIYTRRHDRNTYQRYNAYATLPTGTYDRNTMRGVAWVFTNLSTPT